MELSPRSNDDRRYVRVDTDTVLNVAESLGIQGLGAHVAKDLAEDVTVRLRELADVCCRFLRHSRFVDTMHNNDIKNLTFFMIFKCMKS